MVATDAPEWMIRLYSFFHSTSFVFIISCSEQTGTIINFNKSLNKRDNVAIPIRDVKGL